MALLNRPDKISVDSSSDPSLKFADTNGVFSSFRNQLNTPLLNVRGLQLNRINFVNPMLQLNDSAHLMFFYYKGTTAGTTVSAGNLKCVRLLPSWYVPASGFTTFTKNKYFNSVAELVAALNIAAATGGDDITYNPIWKSDDITFSYDASTRKISFTGNSASSYYAPAAADDPIVIAYLATNAIKMNTWSGILTQPYVSGASMNARLGFAMSYLTRGRFANSYAIVGVATPIQYPVINGTTMEADAYPCLIGSQNINVYCAQVVSSGNDSQKRRNLLATIPLNNLLLQ